MTSDYGSFVIEPFERGFGHTIGNGLRRVLLSSIEGSAITAVRIEHAAHEFDSLDGVYEDVTDIILNLKKLRIKHEGEGTIKCRINKSTKGEVTGADVECEGDASVANPELHIATLTLDTDFVVELDVKRGRGYVPSEENQDVSHPLGTIPVDSIYSPVHRVRYAIEATRVGKFTNYDRLVLEIWTDGTVSPELALVEAAKVYRRHLNAFVMFDPSASEFNEANRENTELNNALEAPISDLELSVRARNCLDGANLRTLYDLVTLSENEVINLKNLGKTSLTEIKNKLSERGLSLGMSV
ncbi:UNVERIFIED_CONTAM: hypothetical protein GTU68_030576 [Idotea baltica]|nr:hypothetical protein [Idotea baltica]